MIHWVYVSIHSAFASNVDDDVEDDDVPVDVFAELLIYADIVGIRRAAPVALTAMAVFITLGRAVTAYATGITLNIANKLTVFLRKDIP